MQADEDTPPRIKRLMKKIPSTTMEAYSISAELTRHFEETMRKGWEKSLARQRRNAAFIAKHGNDLIG